MKIWVEKSNALHWVEMNGRDFYTVLKLNETELNHGGVAKLPSKEIIAMFFQSWEFCVESLNHELQFPALIVTEEKFVSLPKSISICF